LQLKQCVAFGIGAIIVLVCSFGERMHGRAKLSSPPTAKEIEGDCQKSATYQKLVDVLFFRRHNHDYSSETFDLIAQVLRKNPDFSSLWNFRREIILFQEQEFISSQPLSSQSQHELVEKELALSTNAIEKNPKSYCAWYHRVWLSKRYEVNIIDEVNLCNKFLDFDQRNFHCWNYRRYLIDVAKISAVDEFTYSASKISQNFSNYSAFHHRSVFLKVILANDSTGGSDIFPEELRVIENAVFTEPDDQSAWWYYFHIIELITTANGDDLCWRDSILSEQLCTMRELLEAEPHAKWVLVAILNLLNALIRLRIFISGTDLLILQEEILSRLCEADPMRQHCYQHLYLQRSRKQQPGLEAERLA
jgi:geranylgeranyl transferase type-2 subunit alpha